MNTQSTFEQACTNNIPQTLQSINAAKFYLKSQGQSGTAKQVEKLMKQLPAESILMMATQRGYTA